MKQVPRILFAGDVSDEEIVALRHALLESTQERVAKAYCLSVRYVGYVSRGVCRKNVGGPVRQHWTHLTEDDIAEAKLMREKEGKSLSAIAEYIGCTRQTIGRYAKNWVKGDSQ